jgi:hypothetical protein
MNAGVKKRPRFLILQLARSLPKKFLPVIDSRL